ncbi:MAG: YdbH domain-containing protein, partial [Rhodospirillaceae bacterium]|nr:YdbH domain-containing protein [Rhodospirillaceae bacterium]
LTRLDLAGTWSAADGLALTAATAGGRIDMPQQGLTATGVAVEARIPAGAPIRVRFSMASLGQGGDHGRYLVPLTVRGSATVTDERVEAEFSGSAAGEGLVLTVEARHRLADDTGSADLELKPVVFSSDGGLQPWQLFPPIGRAVVQADGTIAASGRIAWGETLTPKIDLALKDLTLVTPQVALRGINGVLTLDGLDPLSTPPGQEIAIGEVDIGLPLTDGLLTFRIEPPSTLRIDRARLSLAGGEIAAAPTAIDWSGGTQQITLAARDLRLQALLELADIEGLSGSGRLAGAIPVGVRDGAVLVNGAVLAAQEPGVLKYDTSEAPQALASAGDSAALALTALRNFHYTALRLEIDRGADAEMRVRIKLDGSNPDLYDGYPVSFNFNVSGKLDQVLSRGLTGYRIPDRIRERLMQFQ